MASDNEIAQNEAAQQLAKFLVTVDPRGYSRKNPLQERIDKEITRLADEIATEVVANTPRLREVLRRKVESVIAAALSNDAWLKTTVVDAVAKALSQLALERHEDED